MRTNSDYFTEQHWLVGWGFSRNCSFKYYRGKFHSSDGSVATPHILPHMSS